MGRPWGLSGPQFLMLYVVGLAVALVLTVVLRRLARRGQAATMPTMVLLPAHIAYLAGGPRRVIEQAVAQLLQAGALRASRGGEVQAVAGSAADPVEHAVLEVARRPQSVASVVRATVTHPAVGQVGDALVAHGLLLARGTAARRARLATLPLWLLLAIGAVRWLTGRVGQYPVGFLTFLLFGTLVSAVFLMARTLPARTVEGDAALRAARRPGDARSHGYQLHPSFAMGGAAAIVALGGLALYPDSVMREILMISQFEQARAHAVASSSSGCSSWTYIGSSSCGSSGGGGSSCGSSSGGGSSCGSSSGGGSSCGGGGGGGCGGGGSS